MKAFEFDPCDDERVFYSVFDFVFFTAYLILAGALPILILVFLEKPTGLKSVVMIMLLSTLVQGAA